MEQRVLTIDGMSCGHCVARVSKALSALPGVRVRDVTVGSAAITFDPGQTTIAQIASALHEVGYRLQSEGTAA